MWSPHWRLKVSSDGVRRNGLDFQVNVKSLTVKPKEASRDKRAGIHLRRGTGIIPPAPHLHSEQQEIFPLVRFTSAVSCQGWSTSAKRHQHHTHTKKIRVICPARLFVVLLNSDRATLARVATASTNIPVRAGKVAARRRRRLSGSVEKHLP